MASIDESFRYFKCHKKDVNCLRIDNAGDNQAIVVLYEENDANVECVSPDASKLKKVVEREFAIG